MSVLVFAFLILLLLFRIYDVFFGSIARSTRHPDDPHRFPLNTFERWGREIAEEEDLKK